MDLKIHYFMVGVASCGETLMAYALPIPFLYLETIPRTDRIRANVGLIRILRIVGTHCCDRPALKRYR